MIGRAVGALRSRRRACRGVARAESRPPGRFEVTPGVAMVLPNDGVAAAIDVLAARVPRDRRVDLLTLRADTIRVCLHGTGRSIDVTCSPGGTVCDVVVHSFEPGAVSHASVTPQGTVKLTDVPFDELVVAFARPRPGDRHLVFVPLPAPDEP